MHTLITGHRRLNLGVGPPPWGAIRTTGTALLFAARLRISHPLPVRLEWQPQLGAEMPSRVQAPHAVEEGIRVVLIVVLHSK